MNYLKIDIKNYGLNNILELITILFSIFRLSAFTRPVHLQIKSLDIQYNHNRFLSNYFLQFQIVHGNKSYVIINAFMALLLLSLETQINFLANENTCRTFSLTITRQEIGFKLNFKQKIKSRERRNCPIILFFKTNR